MNPGQALFDLAGRAVLVTGGNRGIGLGMASGLVRAGASVCVAARSAERNEQAVAKLRGLGGTATSVVCDVTDEASVATAVAATVSAFGRLDGAIVNAGAQAAPHWVQDYPLRDWREALERNLDGAFLTVRESAAQLLRQGEGGSIVVIGSIAADYGQPTMAPYAAAKAAVESLTRTAAVELARHDIRVNAVVPGWTNTGMIQSLVDAEEGSLAERAREAILARTPLRRWGEPEEYAGIAVYLMSGASSFHTGDVITVDGGYGIF